MTKIDEIKEVRCCTCHAAKPTHSFNKNKYNANGLSHECKDCRKEYRRKVAAKNRAYNESYYANNKGFINVKTRLSGAEWRAKGYAVQINDLSALDLLDVLSSQGFDCHYCGSRLSHDFHIDHKTPLFKGGDNTKNNVVASCPKCNYSKGRKGYDNFLGAKK